MNLIITCSRHLEEEASDEVSKILLQLGDITPKVIISRFSGIILAETTLDPFTVINEIRKKIIDEPWGIRYCHRFIPIQETIETTLDYIVKAVQKCSGIMNPIDSYRITVEKRGSKLSSREIIDAVAKIIQNNVSLEKFDWNVIIEVVGKITGISIIKEKEMVSTLKLKRDLAE